MSEIKKITKYFTRSADAFDSLYAEEKVNPLMRFLNRRFRSDIYERFVLSLRHVRRYNIQSILDIGCGSGRYARALYELGVKKITGIDISPRMIELARKQTGDLKNSAEVFNLVCTDFMEFQSEEKHDMVLAMGLFDYISDPVKALTKMKGLCRHSVVASFPSVSLYRTPLRKVRYYFKRCPVYFYTRKEIAAFSSVAGFSRHETTKIKGAGMDYWSVFYI